VDTANELPPDPKTILVVDDELSVLTVVKCMLECGDYNVLLASSAAAALRIASNNDVAIDLLSLTLSCPMNRGRISLNGCCHSSKSHSTPDALRCKLRELLQRHWRGRTARSLRNNRHTLNDHEHVCNTSGLHNMTGVVVKGCV
jgi:CheY-like chemotaxis protein